MKTQLVTLIGDPIENLYQLGKKERSSFRLLEDRVSCLLSANDLLRHGMDILSRARFLLKKEEPSFFSDCIKAYSEGLGIEPSRYLSFISLFELAAHYGQVYPELKGLLPGCTSLFQKTPEGFTHSRLVDFPLLGIFNENPRLYYWQIEGKPTMLNYSCEGLAPLFFQAIHASGFSLALHHKPGKTFHKEGQSIFQIAFDALFEIPTFNEFRKEIKKKISVTKWGFLALDKSGVVHTMDIDGPAMSLETFHLNETTPLIFTNIPLQNDPVGFESYLLFSSQRQDWLKEKCRRLGGLHPLDAMTDIEDQKNQKWLHPSSTLSTVGAYHVNLTQGFVDIKEGESALVSSDRILQFSLANRSEIKILKEAKSLSAFEKSWKRAALAQSAFDQRKWDTAWHELQMAMTLMPHPVWKEIFKFYFCLWNFKFITNDKELALIYRELKTLRLPIHLKDQWQLLIMRMERSLDLRPTVLLEDLSPHLHSLFQAEKLASKRIFSTWMKLLYPRLEILDVFTPYHK